MRTTICLTFDFDALSIWIGTFGQTTPSVLSRGEYGARVGLDRVLGLLREHDVTATFFVPGHTALTFPVETRAIAESGHEIAAHNHVHESPVALTREAERTIFERAEAALAQVAGLRPLGYRSPAFDLGASTLELLEERGYLYDSSMMAADYAPYRPRRGDRVDDDGTFHAGVETGLWEFPVSWELDDFPYFQFMGKGMTGLRSPTEVRDIWWAEFCACQESPAPGVFTLTCHPQIIGRAPRIAMLGELIDRMKSRTDVGFATMQEIALRLNAGKPFVGEVI